MVYVLYNTHAGAHLAAEKIKEKMSEFFKGEKLFLADAVSVDDKRQFVSQILPTDRLVIVGGDGTLNKFVNSIDDKNYEFPIYCYAGGTGNDFINDVAGVDSDGIIMINDYIRNLPTVEVNGKTYKFINGIGYGIDGYCCEEGDKYREKYGKAPNYTTIAIKGLLGKFKTVNAKVTVDGVTNEYKNVWMAPAMNGRYFGGGMMVTPEQDRLNSEHELSFVVVPCKSRLRILTVFPKIFKGEHVKYTNIFKTFRGKSVTVEFDKPTALQIDGETIVGVTKYSARSYAEKKECATV